MKIKYFILIFLLFCTTVVFGQGVKLTASVNKNPVSTGDIFTVTFSVNGNAENFSPPQFKGFEEAGGPNVSTSMESVNGNTSVSTSYSYDLMAVREGTFTIGPASMTVSGRQLRSQPIDIKVVKGRSVPQQSANGEPAPAPTSADVSKQVFIRAVPDKSDVYLGEQITLTYKLYTRLSIDQSQADVIPELNGFWSEDIKPAQQQVPFRIEVYKGERYEVADIKKTILFPERDGNLTIDPLGMTLMVRAPAPARDIMEQFFGSSKEEKYEAKSAPVTIHVKQFPTVGKPESFAGAVGNFSIETSVDKTELKANDAFNYTIKLSGSGNIKLLKNLDVIFPVDFDKYDPKITDSVTMSERGLAGDRFYNYLLIPRHQGNYTIDPLKFSYFNPATGRYVTLTSKGFNIKVDKGKIENNVTAVSDADKQDIKMLSKDIRYIKTGDTGMIKPGDQFFDSFWYYLLLLIGPAVAYGAYAYRNWLIKNNSDLVKVKSRQAGKVAAKHLASAQKQLLAGNSAAFYEDVFSGLYGYLSDKLNIQYADLNKETIESALKSKSVSETLINRLLDTLDLCEMVRYAPVTHISKQDVFDKAKGVINDIENEI